jgi:NAD(P)-dependent dehydrogenase (short-subunit alcohol dehydrogenase family)
MKTVRDIVGGRFDIRVANAVVWKPARQFAVDVRERFFMARQLPPIVGEGGSVAPPSSMAAHAAAGAPAACSATKGAVASASD